MTALTNERIFTTSIPLMLKVNVKQTGKGKNSNEKSSYCPSFSTASPLSRPPIAPPRGKAPFANDQIRVNRFSVIGSL
jgi:hypothetical protein